MVVLFHFSEGHHYSGIALARSARGPRLSVGGILLRAVGLHPHPCLWPRLKDLLTLQRLWRFPAGAADPALSAASVHAAGDLALVILLRLAGAPGRLSLHLRRQVSPGHQHEGLCRSACCWSRPGTRMNTLTWNGVSWFVSVEFALCLLFPAVAVAGARARLWRGFALIAAGLAGLMALLLTSQARAGHHLSQWRAAGAGGFRHRRRHGGAVPRLKPRDRLPGWVHSLLQLLLLGCWPMSITEHRLVAYTQWISSPCCR